MKENEMSQYKGLDKIFNDQTRISKVIAEHIANRAEFYRKQGDINALLCLDKLAIALEEFVENGSIMFNEVSPDDRPNHIETHLTEHGKKLYHALSDYENYNEESRKYSDKIRNRLTDEREFMEANQKAKSLLIKTVLMSILTAVLVAGAVAMSIVAASNPASGIIVGFLSVAAAASGVSTLYSMFGINHYLSKYRAARSDVLKISDKLSNHGLLSRTRVEQNEKSPLIESKGADYSYSSHSIN